MPRTATPTWCFAVVVVRRAGRFLLVHERKHGSTWYLPAGRVEPGESFAEAARRETEEETGVTIILEGVLRVEHTPSPDGGSRMRVVFVAAPEGEGHPRTDPNQHSLGARWVALDELDGLPLRGPDVRAYLEAVQAGATVHPLAVLAPEGSPLPVP